MDFDKQPLLPRLGQRHSTREGHPAPTRVDTMSALAQPATVSAKRAAQLLGVNAEYVRGLVRKGTLRGVKEGRSVAVTIESLNTFRERREAAGEAHRRELHDRLDRLAGVWRTSGKDSDETR